MLKPGDLATFNREYSLYDGHNKYSQNVREGELCLVVSVNKILNADDPKFYSIEVLHQGILKYLTSYIKFDNIER